MVLLKNIGLNIKQKLRLLNLHLQFITYFKISSLRPHCNKELLFMWLSVTYSVYPNNIFLFTPLYTWIYWGGASSCLYNTLVKKSVGLSWIISRVLHFKGMVKSEFILNPELSYQQYTYNTSKPITHILRNYSSIWQKKVYSSL